MSETVTHAPSTHDPVSRPAHYAKGAVQPIDLIDAMDLGFYEGNVVKYVSRWRDKGGVEDLKKARWYLDRLIANLERVDD
jgi:hypothetical protein